MDIYHAGFPPEGGQMSEFNRRPDLRRDQHFSGAVVTLEGLRPPLSGSAARRAVAVSSVGFGDRLKR